FGLAAFAVTAAWARSAARTQDGTMEEESWSVAGLGGTLALPKGSPAHGPAALIIAGSGPTPRDGNFGTYRLIAADLAAAGIRSLRYDKRGIGTSRGLIVREDELRFDHFVDDAVVATRDLAARADVSTVI